MHFIILLELYLFFIIIGREHGPMSKKKGAAPYPSSSRPSPSNWQTRRHQMHEEKIRFSRTSQKTQRNTNPQYPSFHKNIIKLIEALYDEPNGNSPPYSGKLALFFELIDMNMYSCLKNKKTPHRPKIKYYMFQVIKSIDFMHKKASFIGLSNPKISSSRAICQVGRSRLLQGTTQPYTDHISIR